MSIIPLFCGKKDNNSKSIQDICVLEYSRYLTNSYYSVKCEIDNISYLKCTITNTEGFPISDKCFNDRDVKICLH